MNRSARWVIIAFILLFSWMMLSGWTSDTPKQRFYELLFVGFMLLLALGLAAPSRFVVALRVVAGIVAITYAGYFLSEIANLLRGQRQSLAIGQPSATMAGLGFLFYGVPALVFALGAERVGLAKLFRAKRGSHATADVDVGDGDADDRDLDQHSNER